jgi:hypothetical protein
MSAAGIQAAPAASFDLMGMDRKIQRRVTSRRLLAGAAWVGLMAAGLKRGGLIGWVGVSAGALGLGVQVSSWLEARPEWSKARHEPLVLRRLLAVRHADRVDESVKETFPASDPTALQGH